MKPGMIGSCIPLLLTGCAFYGDLPIHAEYRRIHVGQPPPAEIRENPDWGLCEKDGRARGRRRRCFATSATTSSTASTAWGWCATAGGTARPTVAARS